MVGLLLNLGANPNLLDCDGDAPLHWACTNDYPQVVQILIQNGADINMPNDVLFRLQSYDAEFL